MSQLSLQGMTIAEHEANNRQLQMTIIKLREENKQLREQVKDAVSLKEYSYMMRGK